ncbi:MAG: hypothetical protein Kow0091_01160 [Geminocystis sp.]
MSSNFSDKKASAQIQSTPSENLLRNRYYFKLGLQQVDNICQSFTSSSLKNDCNKILSETTFFDPDAVFFCEQKFNISSRTITCFKYIQDKFYVESELKDCGNSMNYSNIFKCLSKKGRPYI